MSKHGYPTYRFGHGGAQVRVENEEEDRALPGPWYDHPPGEGSEPRTFDDASDDDIDEMLAEEAHDEPVIAKPKKKKKQGG